MIQSQYVPDLVEDAGRKKAAVNALGERITYRASGGIRWTAEVWALGPENRSLYSGVGHHNVMMSMTTGGWLFVCNR